MTSPHPNPLGGTGDPPVPVGDPPTGTRETIAKFGGTYQNLNAVNQL